MSSIYLFFASVNSHLDYHSIILMSIDHSVSVNIIVFFFHVAMQVHMCNKLASRHVRVGLADPNKLVRCDICENSPAFFYCEVDGTSLCLSCDMTVHVGGKRTHGRYLLLRQRVEFPGDKPGHMDDVAMQTKEQMANNHNGTDDPASDGNCNDQGNIDSKMIDLNMQPVRTHGQGSNSQGADHSINNHDSPGVVPSSNYERDADK
ncbi:hypothetical protein EJB05_43649 [Eragrostis curvula]|uniref:B box-type domain-containing protein n=1 Tax=Eragrostis curvula TaxID=38414 RepID=A0A5J9TFN3_9POAL|nr:hypothetical protein EJB05_43649 [Eragrostis curvula]